MRWRLVSAVVSITGRGYIRRRHLAIATRRQRPHRRSALADDAIPHLWQVRQDGHRKRVAHLHFAVLGIGLAQLLGVKRVWRRILRSPRTRVNVSRRTYNHAVEDYSLRRIQPFRRQVEPARRINGKDAVNAPQPLDRRKFQAGGNRRVHSRPMRIPTQREVVRQGIRTRLRIGTHRDALAIRGENRNSARIVETEVRRPAQEIKRARKRRLRARRRDPERHRREEIVCADWQTETVVRGNGEDSAQPVGLPLDHYARASPPLRLVRARRDKIVLPGANTAYCKSPRNEIAGPAGRSKRERRRRNSPCIEVRRL